MAESQTDLAVRAWHDSNPAWTSIADYVGGDVLLELDDGTLAFGACRENCSWVQFVGGVALRLCGPEAEGEDDVIGHLTTPREPVRFCVVPDDIAVHFMAH